MAPLGTRRARARGDAPRPRRVPKVRPLLAVLLLAPAVSEAAPAQLREGPRAPVEQPRKRAKHAPSFDAVDALGLDGDTVNDLALRRGDDGSYRYVDPAGNFTAEFHQDGTVHFADRWKKPSLRRPEHGACCGLPPGFSIGTSMRVTGPTEWLMAMAGMDPGAREKAALLKKTAEIRTRMAVAHNLELLRSRYAALDRDLFDVWSRGDLPIAARRELLFALWDECDEAFSVNPGDVPLAALTYIDQARKHTAERARRSIERFIRRHMPRGSGRSFTADGFERLNAGRESAQSFDPYTPRPEPPPLAAAMERPDDAREPSD